MIVNVRTRDDLRVLERNGQTGNWKIGGGSAYRITRVRVFNWDGTEVLIGDYDPNNTFRDQAGRLVIGIKNGRIIKVAFDWYRTFQRANTIYTQEVAIQISGGIKTGIVRGKYSATLTQKEITEYFRRLMREMMLQGIKKIVFQGGGNIQIPDWFTEWCQANGVDIEITGEDELNNRYPPHDDLLFFNHS